MVKKHRKQELIDFYEPRQRHWPMLCNIELYAQTLQIELLLQPLGISMPQNGTSFTTVKHALLDCLCIIKALEESIFLYRRYLFGTDKYQRRTELTLNRKLQSEKAEAALLMEFADQPLHAVNIMMLFTYVMDTQSPRVRNLVANLINKMKEEN